MTAAAQECVGVYIVWDVHGQTGTPLLEVEADLFKISKGHNFPTDFHSYIWRVTNSNKNTN